MGMTSPAEAKLEAKVRPQIAAMQARSGYPRLRLVGAGASEETADTGAPATPPRRAGRTPIRLTRRGRIVVGVLAAIGVAAVASLIWLTVTGQAQAASHAGPQVPWRDSVQRVVVRPGDSLWSIADKTDPGADPRAVISQIVELNSLRGTGIQVGQVLWVPKS
jgi:nucleoid-associated protein YgaU